MMCGGFTKSVWKGLLWGACFFWCLAVGASPTFAKSSEPSISPFFESLRASAEAMGRGDVIAWKGALEKAEALKTFFLKDRPSDWSYDRQIWLGVMRYHFHLAQVNCPLPSEGTVPLRSEVKRLHRGARLCLKQLEKAISYFQVYFRKLCGYRCLAPKQRKSAYALQSVRQIQRLQFQRHLLQDYERFLFQALWSWSKKNAPTKRLRKKWSTWRVLLAYGGLHVSASKRRQQLKKKATLFLATLRAFRGQTTLARRLHGPILEMATIGLLFALSTATGILVYITLMEAQQFNLQSPYIEANLAVLATVGSVGMLVGMIAIFALPDVFLYRKLQATHARYLADQAPLLGGNKRRKRLLLENKIKRERASYQSSPAWRGKGHKSLLYATW